ncbi:MAG TPA: thermonuclease family protein [Gemmatimonadales bacterium]|nr:thermonuclease family protein [Gemmatimonadales bacterium]
MPHHTLLAGLLLAGLALQSCSDGPRAAAAQPSLCVVERIADGDTFTCRDGRRVRLIGVDTPELAQGESGRRARATLTRLAPVGAAVRLERDVAPRDRYGRELAHVWNGSRLVSEALVLEGWAMLYTVPPNVKYADRLGRAQKRAREAGAGLWGSGGFACAPAAFRRGECR